jgi:hypothetical protein
MDVNRIKVLGSVRSRRATAYERNVRERARRDTEPPTRSSSVRIWIWLSLMVEKSEWKMGTASNTASGRDKSKNGEHQKEPPSSGHGVMLQSGEKGKDGSFSNTVSTGVGETTRFVASHSTGLDGMVMQGSSDA